MRVVTGVDELVAKYVAQRTGIGMPDKGMYTGFAVKNAKNEFVAGVVVTNWRGTDCEISMAAETANWAHKGIMRVIFEYVFNTAGCVRCTCIVKNVKASSRTRRFLTGIGFRLEGNLRRAYDGKHGALVYGLLREECRFLGGLDGKENRTGAAARTRSDCDRAGADSIQ